MKIKTLTLLGVLLWSGAALADNHGAEEAEPKAEVYIISPQDGAVVESPVRVVFGLRGMGVAPAGVEHDNTGHHHLLINVDPPEGEALKENLPADENHVHFGGGQTETEIELEPGEHTLQLLLADHNHIPHDPVILSEQITITVKGEDEGGVVKDVLDGTLGILGGEKSE